MTDVSPFLEAAGWADATPTPMTPDASARRYTRLTRGNTTTILMEDPTGSVARFARLSGYLLSLGLSAPKVYAMEADGGLMLLEDLGDDRFANHIETAPEDEDRLYRAAAQVLVTLHRAPAPRGLEEAGPPVLAGMIEPVFSHYAPWCGLNVPPGQRRLVRVALTDTLAAHADLPGVTVLRDFHAENLMWLPARSGVARAGLLDFQDAICGPGAYDLVSLLQDARRDVSDSAKSAARQVYLEGTGLDAEVLDTAMTVLGVQRNLRILGIFVRLAQEHGKTRYLDLIPRVWGQLEEGLTHPALSRVASQINSILPHPPR